MADQVLARLLAGTQGSRKAGQCSLAQCFSSLRACQQRQHNVVELGITRVSWRAQQGMGHDLLKRSWSMM